MEMYIIDVERLRTGNRGEHEVARHGSYESREMALKDGVLIDVSGAAMKMGATVPVAIEEALYEDYITKSVDCDSWDEDARLVAIVGAVLRKLQRNQGLPIVSCTVDFDEPNGLSDTRATVHAHCGPYGSGERTVITLHGTRTEVSFRQACSKPAI